MLEVRPPSQRPEELREKMRACLANGSRLAVLIDPSARTVEVYRPDRELQHYRHPDRVALDPELPGFVLEPESV